MILLRLPTHGEHRHNRVELIWLEKLEEVVFCAIHKSRPKKNK